MSAFKSPIDRRRTTYIAAAIGLAAILAPAFAGCGQPPLIVPKGAWSVSFIDSGVDCNIAGHNTVVGEVTGDSRTKLVEDGQDDTDVSCAVIEGDKGFEVEANERLNEALLTILIPELPANASKDKPAKGTVQYKSHDTADFFNSTECIFYFKDGTGQGVKAGQVWLTFVCPTIDGEAGTCKIEPGYAAFESCRITDE
jgi:hypothetical protein